MEDALHRESRPGDAGFFYDFSVQAAVMDGKPAVQYVFVVGTDSPLPEEGPIFTTNALAFPAPTQDMIGAVVSVSVKSLRELAAQKMAPLN